MYNAPYHGPFSLLPERRPPWKEFIFSFSSQGLGLFLLTWLAVLHPEVLVPPTHDYHFIRLVETPAPINHQPQPPRVLKQELARLETPTEPVLRSEEHTSELQSLRHLVCRLLLEKKKNHN